MIQLVYLHLVFITSSALIAVSLPRFVVRKNVALRMFIHNSNIVVGQVDWFNPVTRCVNDYWNASTIHAARDQHRHQAYG